MEQVDDVLEAELLVGLLRKDDALLRGEVLSLCFGWCVSLSLSLWAIFGRGGTLLGDGASGKEEQEEEEQRQNLALTTSTEPGSTEMVRS